MAAFRGAVADRARRKAASKTASKAAKRPRSEAKPSGARAPAKAGPRSEAKPSEGPACRLLAGRQPAKAGRRAPLLLAVETSGAEPSVALLRGDELLAERRARPGRPGSEMLLPAIDALLRRAGVEVSALGAFAVGVGPGSFTGLRVGIATVKGLAFGSDARVAAVGTLAALALRAPRSRDPVVAVLDARRGEVYAASFRRNREDLEPTDLPEGLYTPEELASRLPPRCLLVGDGVAVCGDRLREALGPGVRCLPPPRGLPRAREVGALGLGMLRRGEAIDAADLVPRYVRRAEAEARRIGQATEPANG